MRSGQKPWSVWVSKRRLLIFDWDGTLADSIGRIVASVRAAAAICDLPPRDDAAIRGIIGLALPEAIATLYPQLAGAPMSETFRLAYAEHYLGLDVEPSALFPGVVEGLQRFRDEGYLLAVATGKGRQGLDRVLHGVGMSDFFDITRCADETASKPHPLMIQEILEHCRVLPEQALMVGDSVFDLQMARNAGVDSVAVTYGAQPLDALLACAPEFVIDHFSELGRCLGVTSTTEAGAYVG